MLLRAMLLAILIQIQRSTNFVIDCTLRVTNFWEFTVSKNDHGKSSKKNIRNDVKAKIKRKAMSTLKSDSDHS